MWLPALENVSTYPVGQIDIVCVVYLRTQTIMKWLSGENKREAGHVSIALV